MVSLKLFKYGFLVFSLLFCFSALSEDLPNPVCFQLEGLKPTCVPGSFCVGECEDVAKNVSRCTSVSVCGKVCRGQAPPEPIECTGTCYAPVTTSYKYKSAQQVCPGGRQCEAYAPDETVCDENGCRVIGGACIKYSDCPSQCVEKTGSCTTSYTGTPNKARSDGCGCECTGLPTPPTVPTCTPKPSSC